MSELKYGFHNHMVVTLGYQGTVTGNGSSRAVSCGKFYLPMHAHLVGIYATCLTCASAGTSTLNVLAGTNKVTTDGLALSSGTTSAANVSILPSYASSDAGTLFSLVENTTNAILVVNPTVTLYFRPQIE